MECRDRRVSAAVGEGAMLTRERRRHGDPRLGRSCTVARRGLLLRGLAGVATAKAWGRGVRPKKCVCVLLQATRRWGQAGTTTTGLNGELRLVQGQGKSDAVPAWCTAVDVRARVRVIAIMGNRRLIAPSSRLY